LSVAGNNPTHALVRFMSYWFAYPSMGSCRTTTAALANPRRTRITPIHCRTKSRNSTRRSVRQNDDMRFLLIACLLAAALAGEAKTLRWSSQGDYLSADPHGQNEGINNLINDEIYERLVVRDRKLEIVPGLATSWEMVSPTRWRFHLRRGVVFHDGTPLTADDVVFSIERAQAPTSNFKVYAGPLGKARKVDDFTVDLETPVPTPVLVENAALVNIMSRAWCEKHGVTRAQDFKSGEETYARAPPTAPVPSCS
jgi:ABC-type transport system substrate-binding protein